VEAGPRGGARERGSASQTGDRGSASQTGERGSASQTGDRGVAVCVGERITIEVSGKGSLGCTTASRWIWKIHDGAVVACRWIDDKKCEGHKMLAAEELGLKDGSTVKVEFGDVVEKWSNE
jgi:hypothetical protein